MHLSCRVQHHHSEVQWITVPAASQAGAWTELPVDLQQKRVLQQDGFRTDPPAYWSMAYAHSTTGLQPPRTPPGTTTPRCFGAACERATGP